MSCKLETVVDALVDALQTNADATATSAGTTYPVDLVQVMLHWPDLRHLPVGHNTVYLIRLVQQQGGPAVSCQVNESVRVAIVALHRFDSPSDNPFNESPERWRISANLVADVLEKLRRNEKLDATVLTVFEGPGGTQSTADHEGYLKQWVVPELQVSIRYRYGKDER